MSEEEKILEFIQQEYENYDNYVRDLLDLYNKEKEKNKELEKYENYYKNERVQLIPKSKVKEAIDNGISDAKGWGCEEGAYCVKKEFERMGILEERN